MSPSRLAASVLALITGFAAVWACSSSGGNGTGPGGTNVSLSGCITDNEAGTCSAQGCFCNRGNFGPDAAGCSFTCGTPPAEGGLQIDCAQQYGCSGTCMQGCEFNCAQGQCALSVGAGSQVDCAQAAGCTGTVGAGASVICLQAGCTLTLGAGANVDCEQAHSCDLTCTGDCTVNCQQATACSVHCTEGADCGVSGFACNFMSCPDGLTQVCGSAKCP
jgi:hypothetical protein